MVCWYKRSSLFHKNIIEREKGWTTLTPVRAFSSLTNDTIVGEKWEVFYIFTASIN